MGPGSAEAEGYPELAVIFNPSNFLHSQESAGILMLTLPDGLAVSVKGSSPTLWLISISGIKSQFI